MGQNACREQKSNLCVLVRILSCKRQKQILVDLSRKETYKKGGGGVFRVGNTCTPMADSCQCMAKTTTIL